MVVILIALFETFLYPYIDRKTLLAIHNIFFLLEFFNYLQECCRIIEKILLKEDREIPLYKHVCNWNKLLDKDNDRDRDHLLGSLVDIFGLENRYLEDISIEKVDDDSNNTLRISNPAFCIVIELDRKGEKAIAKLLDKNKKYEYFIKELDSDNIFVRTRHSEKEGLLDFELQATRRLGESLIYRIVSGLDVLHRVDMGGGTKDLYQDNKFMGELRELSEDNKFMILADNINKQFEKGYKMLKKLRYSQL